MKIIKLLTIKLVAPKYIVVEENGQNRTIEMVDTSMYHIGNMFELTYPIKESSVNTSLPIENLDGSENKEILGEASVKSDDSVEKVQEENVSLG